MAMLVRCSRTTGSCLRWYFCQSPAATAPAPALTGRGSSAAAGSSVAPKADCGPAAAALALTVAKGLPARPAVIVPGCCCACAAHCCGNEVRRVYRHSYSRHNVWFTLADCSDVGPKPLHHPQTRLQSSCRPQAGRCSTNAPSALLVYYPPRACNATHRDGSSVSGRSRLGPLLGSAPGRRRASRRRGSRRLA